MEGNERHYSADRSGILIIKGEPSSWMCPSARIYLHASHELRPYEQEKCAICVHLTAPHYQAMLAELQPQDGEQPLPNPDGLTLLTVENSGLVRRIAQDILSAPYSGEELRLYLHGKIIELLVAGMMGNQLTRSSERHAHSVRDILLASPHKTPSLHDISRTLGIPAYRLNDEFRKTFGLSVSGWLREWRLLRARDLLVEGKLPVKEVAFSVGYSHVASFTTAFRRRFGVPPMQLRSRKLNRDVT